MANVTFDIMWREAMMELLDQLEAENPEDPALAPKDLSEWACIYIKYIQILRKLETAYDQMVHPQKRLDMRKALESCIGRMLEIRHWMVKLNRGLDFISLDDILVDLKLTPEVLEVPVPKYFIEDRAKELDDRDKFLEALVEKYNVKPPQPSPIIKIGAPLLEDDAILLIQKNERGRQARERARMMSILKKQRQIEDKRSRMGVPLSHEEAARRIQAAIRGFIWRRRIKKESDTELMFIGMKPKPRDARKDPQISEAKNLMRRKRIQLEHAREYDEAIVTLKQKVRELEGQDMRETIQDKINSWFVANRNEETGEYPDFPDQDDGGSKVILNPPPPTLDSLLEDLNDPKAKAKDKKPDKKATDKKGKKGEEVAEVKEEKISSVFIPSIEAAVHEFVAKWQDRDETDNFFQKYDAELVKDELRPIVFEEIRLQVDEEMRVLLQNLKDMVDAERAAKLGKKGKKKKKKGKKKGKKGKKDKKGKKKKDPTSDRSIESLFAELVSNGILQPCPHVHVRDFLGSSSFMQATLEKANVIPDPSLAQIRQALTEYAILPLGSQYIHERAPYIKSVLMYGGEKTGKSLLSHAVANLSGANFFDLSPRNTDGKYPGKNVNMMMHMVFKVARTMAPSVIYIDEAEKVFLSDKKKLREFGSSEPFNRIRKELLKECKSLGSGERVLIVGNSREPFLCAKKDEKAFMGFWTKHVFLPAPDYASRKVIWPGLFERHGGRLSVDFDLSTLAHITQGYTSGHMDMVVHSMLTKRRLERLKHFYVDIPEILQWLCKVDPLSKEQDEALRKWMDKTPAMAIVKGGAKPGTAASGKGDKKDKKKKKK
mmetsp:Transcript_33907/g.75181  ORF Transcript_33907/g.75181 Transcript_33907/m.75181 type:complete len:829 (-) Transcript_33907:621-3107(-)|eukprot:CAMPEP_0202919832 /NCGR_PEP_ID=MMETSP1392-20130828/76537_1 /ASSEMBLY_ACC=CAM_ASM_000868 /TAXON_ID=225041 /ORGANISM="Chlamydomonas chlamydogama, Strain SAG 11-48b" /LENGTH=828 /DNA_ID=CAMNT_0049613291 /DNA_START=134 /DNA_END=2620 /DNA_ORIENTATION=+